MEQYKPRRPKTKEGRPYKKRTHEEVIYEQLKKELFELFDEDEAFRDGVKEGLYKDEDEALADCLQELDICIVEGGLIVEGYNTTNYRTCEEMVRDMVYMATEIHESNWWEGILDEDDFCDCEAGDDPEYVNIMSTASLIEELNRNLTVWVFGK